MELVFNKDPNQTAAQYMKECAFLQTVTVSPRQLQKCEDIFENPLLAGTLYNKINKPIQAYNFSNPRSTICQPIHSTFQEGEYILVLQLLLLLNNLGWTRFEKSPFSVNIGISEVETPHGRLLPFEFFENNITALRVIVETIIGSNQDEVEYVLLYLYKKVYLA